MAAVAIDDGSDTGGSIRIPASLCGITGLKPTYGRVSRLGVEPPAWSLDHLGPLASSVDGTVASLQAIAGEDVDDASTWGLAMPKEQEEIDYRSMSEPVTLSYVRTTAPFNLSGLPAMTVPAGFDGDGLAVGLQIAGRPYDEAMIVRVGRHFEQLEFGTDRLPEVHVDRIAA